MTEAHTSERRPRLLPGPLTLLLLAVPAAALVYTKATYGTGDTGMNNGLAYAAALVFFGIYGLWFLLASRQSMGVKAFTVALAAAVVALASLCVRIEGWTGAMLPVLRWSWEADPAAELGNDRQSAEAPLDLSTTTPNDFSGFFGSDRTGRVVSPELARDWKAQPPVELWRTPVGSGWSGFAVVNGTAITQEQRGDDQVVVARDLGTGAELWRDAHPGRYVSTLAGDGPRATPTIAAGLVYVQDVRGVLSCLDGATGAVVWERDLFQEYGWNDAAEEALVAYGRSASPLVFDGKLLVPVSGPSESRRAGVLCVDAATGETLWEGPPRHFSHGSPVLATLCGVEQLVVPNEASVSGHDPSDGSILWEHDWKGITSASASNSNPTIVGDDCVLLSKGYGQGSMLLKLTRSADGAFSTEEVWAVRRSLQTKITNPILHEDHAYALSDGMLECVSLADGKRIWKEGRHGHGQLLLALQPGGALLVVLSEEGRLLLVEASPESEGAVLASIEALDGKTWNTFALYGDRVVVRNGEEAACYRLPTVPQ